MGPYGPSVEERKRLQLEELKEMYGDHPYEDLLRLADEEMTKKIEDLNKKPRHRKSA
jgi:hypothetical protein